MFNITIMEERNNYIKKGIFYGVAISCGLYVAYESYNYFEKVATDYIKNKKVIPKTSAYFL